MTTLFPKRIYSTILWDFRLQFRNGFYYAVLVVVLFSIVLLKQLPRDTLAYVLPIFILGNLLMNGYFFISGLVLLEKGEGTLEAQIVTPLRSQEYLFAKVATLTLLSLVENLTVTALTYGFAPYLLKVAVGLLLAVPLFALVGFIVVVRYDAINEFLLPSILVASVLSLPMITYFGLDLTWLIHLHPLQGSLTWFTAAFQPDVVPIWQLIMSFFYSLVWIVCGVYLGRRAFYRFVVLKEGVR
jgi:fluoroquinolone transport system permease protein